MCLDIKIYLFILNGFYNNDLKLLKIFCPFITTCNPERVSNSTVWLEVLSPPFQWHQPIGNYPGILLTNIVQRSSSVVTFLTLENNIFKLQCGLEIAIAVAAHWEITTPEVCPSGWKENSSSCQSVTGVDYQTFVKRQKQTQAFLQ